MNRRSFLRRTLAAACLGAGLALGQYREPGVKSDESPKPEPEVYAATVCIAFDTGEGKPAEHYSFSIDPEKLNEAQRAWFNRQTELPASTACSMVERVMSDRKDAAKA